MAQKHERQVWGKSRCGLKQTKRFTFVGDEQTQRGNVLFCMVCSYKCPAKKTFDVATLVMLRVTFNDDSSKKNILAH